MILDLVDAYVEVKSVTLTRQAGLAEFPDNVTARGRTHRSELAGMARQGRRALVLYLAQRTDSDRFVPATDIDPANAAAHVAAAAEGVERLVCGTRVTPDEITMGPPISAQD